MGKLRGTNISGTEYILYDNGEKKSSRNKHSNSTENLRRELAAIVYVNFYFLTCLSTLNCCFYL